MLKTKNIKYFIYIYKVTENDVLKQNQYSLFKTKVV